MNQFTKLKFCTIVLFASLYFFASASYGQNKHTTYWHFGRNATLDFSSGSPVSIRGSALSTSEGSLSYSDKTTGKLLMYSDGRTVWDRTNRPMPNGSGLRGNASSAQSGVVIPKPGSNTQYYIITVDRTGSGRHGVSYSTVDMSLAGNGTPANPAGDVIPTGKNTNLQPQRVTEAGIKYEISEKIGVARHCNGTDYWVVLERATANATRYYIYKVSSTGFTLVSSNTYGTTMPDQVGYIRFAQDGKHMAVTHYYDHDTRGTGTGTQLYTFNHSTGVLSLKYTLPHSGSFDGPVGVEFSRDSRLLYVANFDGGIVNQLSVYATSQAIFTQSANKIIDYSGKIGAMQIGLDDNIYFAQRGKKSLGRITNINSFGGAIATAEAVKLIHGKCSEGLPTFYANNIGSYDNLNVSLCVTSGILDLNSKINGDLLPGGTWIDQSGFGSGFNAATGKINPQGVASGYYSFTYTEGTTTGCTRRKATVRVLVIGAISKDNATSNPTSCTANNGKIVLAGALKNTLYKVSYRKNGAPATTVNITSDNAGKITINSLGVGVYSEIKVNNSGCNSNELTIDLSFPTTPTGNNSQTFCKGINPKISDLVANGTNIKWYDAQQGGNLLASNRPLINGNRYYASQTVGACESKNRFEVVVTLKNCNTTVQFDRQGTGGLESIPTAKLKVKLSATSTKTVSVDYKVTGGTATGGGVDYTLANGTLQIPAGQTTKDITIGIVNDLLDEIHETVIVTLSNPTNATLGAIKTHTYLILDNDAPPKISFKKTSSSGSESVPSAKLAVNLSNPSGKEVSVTYKVTGTATGGGTDYTLRNGTLKFAPGESTKNITISGIVNDNITEPNETVIVTLSRPYLNATLGTNKVHTYTIIDNDGNAPTVAFDRQGTGGLESIPTAKLKVKLSATSTKTVSVAYKVTGGTATGGGVDYTLANGTLQIPAGQTTKDITITGIVDDLLDEIHETVIVTLSNPTNATLGTIKTHTYLILDNDAPPKISFKKTSSSGSESVPSAKLAVNLSNPSGKEVSVTYKVTGTATGGGTDYTLRNGTLKFAPGESTKNITISGIVNDNITEPNETVIVTLSRPYLNATLGTNKVHTYTIIDNDGNAPTVAFDMKGTGGLESIPTAKLKVKLSDASTKTVSVDYKVTGGTATGGGVDYTLANGTLQIPAGQTTKDITITGIVDDLLDEINETVIVTLSNPTNATLGTIKAHTYLILDNDAPPKISFKKTSSSGSESVPSAKLAVNLSNPSGKEVSVTYKVTGTATGGGTDYTLRNGTLKFAPGESTKNITISGIVDDNITEPNETVIVTLSRPYLNATLGTNKVHTYTIIDNDGNAPTVAFDRQGTGGLESIPTAKLKVKLSAASTKTVSVDYKVTGGTATGGGVDYTLANGTLKIPAGQTTKDITIGIVNDLLDEIHETVIVTLSNPTNATLGTIKTHTYLILDNDAPPKISFQKTSSSGSESVPSAKLAVNLSNPSGKEVSVTYKVTGTATGGGTDYTLRNGTLKFAPGESTKNITISGIVDDNITEPKETVIVTLSRPYLNATLGTNKVHTYTIIDNDGNAPTVAFDMNGTGGLESIPTAKLKVKLSAASTKTVSVDYKVTGGTATGGGVDYTLANGTLQIPAGQTTKDITITGIVDDLLDEINETVIVTLSNPTNATLGTIKAHTYLILDNDATPKISFKKTSSSGSESVPSAKLAVNLSNPSGKEVSVTYKVTGTATGGGTDYTLRNGTLKFAPGESTKDITIAGIDDDNITEPNETVIVTLSRPYLNATLGTNKVHTYTIIDNDKKVDDVRPSVDILNEPISVKNKNPYNVTFKFSEEVKGFELGDVVVGNGTASNFHKKDGSTYTADITPSGKGDITIDVADGVASDLADNPNTKAVQALTLYIPNEKVKPTAGFSPNNDGNNDTWKIKNIEDFPNNIVKVFNRWGNEVFAIEKYDNKGRAWNGNSNGKLTIGKSQVPDGTYFYFIDLGNGKDPISGYVIVKR